MQTMAERPARQLDVQHGVNRDQKMEQLFQTAPCQKQGKYLKPKNIKSSFA